MANTAWYATDFSADPAKIEETMARKQKEDGGFKAENDDTTLKI